MTSDTKPIRGAVETVVAQPRRLGGLDIRRVLPSPQRRMVGPFIFADHMGPAALRPGEGIDVRPHPHINLATVTYLFEGEILHRDSLGTQQLIRPREVNWMTAGRGIVHSERTPDAARVRGGRLAGMQTWVALPAPVEETAPAFAHYDESELPRIDAAGRTVRLIAGSLYGSTAPVQIFSPMFYAHVELQAGAELPLESEYPERAAYVAAGEVDLAGERHGPGELIVFPPDERATLVAASAACVMLLGGAPLEGPRHIWWNFVSSRADRIREAAADWKARRFAAVPGDDVEFIPLPDDTGMEPRMPSG